jgi:hypothetical protein
LLKVQKRIVPLGVLYYFGDATRKQAGKLLEKLKGAITDGRTRNQPFCG